MGESPIAETRYCDDDLRYHATILGNCQTSRSLLAQLRLPEQRLVTKNVFVLAPQVCLLSNVPLLSLFLLAPSLHRFEIYMYQQSRDWSTFRMSDLYHSYAICKDPLHCPHLTHVLSPVTRARNFHEEDIILYKKTLTRKTTPTNDQSEGLNTDTTKRARGTVSGLHHAPFTPPRSLSPEQE